MYIDEQWGVAKLHLYHVIVHIFAVLILPNISFELENVSLNFNTRSILCKLKYSCHLENLSYLCLRSFVHPLHLKQNAVLGSKPHVKFSVVSSFMKENESYSMM